MNNLAAGPSATWQVVLSLVGGVGAVYAGYRFKLTGKVWLFIGGALVGGTVGYLIDNQGA